MASLAPDPFSGACSDKRALGLAYLNAVHEVNELLDAQARALVKGDAEVERLEIELALMEARERRDRTKLAWAAHVEGHGCC